MKILHVMAAAAAIALAGCVSTPNLISGTAEGVGLRVTNPTIVTDLQSAAFNLDSAVAVGALEANDPAPKCVHDVLIKAGIEVPEGASPAKSFVPKKDGVASAGAIAYILAQQAKKIANTPHSIDPSCEALVGRVVIDGANVLNKAVPFIVR